MPKKELKAEEEIEQAINDVRIAMLEKVKADRNANLANIKKDQARFKLQKANERLRAVELSLK